jgi:hypothetical protein
MLGLTKCGLQEIWSHLLQYVTMRPVINLGMSDLIATVSGFAVQWFVECVDP